MNDITTPQQPKPPALRGGGNVMSIVPQTFEETWRVASAVYKGGLAPAALIGKNEGDAAISAIAICIMSGAELGLQPMVSLRSFTVINGKPALYGDGLINVVRQSGKVKYLRTGCDTVDGKMVGWCEAMRNDTDEDKRVEFSQDDAARAGLWQANATIRKQVWENGSKVWKDNAPNDSPWYRFPQRMLQWRAAGYCLRELFGDVLGGMRDEFEAREIADVEEMRDVTPTKPQSFSFPDVPAQVEDDFLGTIEVKLALAQTEEDVEAEFDALDVQSTLTDDEEALTRAFEIKAEHIARVNNPVAGTESDTQDDMFPGERG